MNILMETLFTIFALGFTAIVVWIIFSTGLWILAGAIVISILIFK